VRRSAGEQDRSVLVIGIHKAGSSVLEVCLEQLAAAKRMRYRPLSRGIMRSRLTLPERLARDAETLDVHGHCFGVVRSPHFAVIGSRLQHFSLIAQVRDPRDCLTSSYFSVAYSHSLPRDRAKRAHFAARRETARSTPIDEWVLNEVEVFQERFAAVVALSRERADMPVMKYESMVSENETWLGELCAAFGVELTDRRRRRLIASAGFGVSKEDPMKHKRQVQVGDHRRKLLPVTIARLDTAFAPILEHFGYEHG